VLTGYPEATSKNKQLRKTCQSRMQRGVVVDRDKMAAGAAHKTEAGREVQMTATGRAWFVSVKGHADSTRLWRETRALIGEGSRGGRERPQSLPRIEGPAMRGHERTSSRIRGDEQISVRSLYACP